MKLNLIIGALLVILGTHAILTHLKPVRHRRIPSPRLPPQISSSTTVPYDPQLQQRLLEQINQKQSLKDQDVLKETLIARIPVEGQTQESTEKGSPEQNQEVAQQLNQNLEQQMYNSLETFQVRPEGFQNRSATHVRPEGFQNLNFRAPRDHGHPQGPPLGVIERNPMRLPITPPQLAQSPPLSMSAGLEYDEPSPDVVHASNISLPEATSTFGSQFTDVAQYFTQHPRELTRDIPLDSAYHLFGPSPPSYLRSP